MSELVRGSPMPLFDRLSSSEEAGRAGAFFLSPADLEASIARELARLFNTRSRLPMSQYAQSTGTVLDYGLPDFSALSARRDEDRSALEAALVQAIAHYEPRLANVRVKVQPDPDRGEVAAVTIGGDMSIGLQQQRVSFALDLSASKDVAGAS